MFIIQRPHSYRGLPALAALAALLSISIAAAQETGEDATTTTGTIVSASRNTVTLRTGTNQYQLFIFDRDTNRPATLPVGSQARVVSSPGDEPGVRLASSITVTGQGSASRDTSESGTGAGSTVVPREVRRLERNIEREAKRFQLGVRGGVGLDPELVLIGVQSQIGPFFSPDLYLRPNVEFGYGEVTALFGLNLEAIYRLPINSRRGRWSAYFGAGPGFNFVHRSFDQGDRIDFDDFHSDTGLNILGGMRFRSGAFAELKTSVYSSSSPTLRLMVGYSF
jgi:opacity protein-like surface antigen